MEMSKEAVVSKRNIFMFWHTRSFNEGRGVHARRNVRRPGRAIKARLGHNRRKERS